MMSSQQQADAWLQVWQQLRARGLTPGERDAIIQREVDLHNEQRLFAALAEINSHRRTVPWPISIKSPS